VILEIIVHSHEATELVNLLSIKWTPWCVEPGFFFGIHLAIQHDERYAPTDQGGLNKPKRENGEQAKYITHMDD